MACPESDRLTLLNDAMERRAYASNTLEEKRSSPCDMRSMAWDSLLLLVIAVANVVSRIGKKYLAIQSRVSAVGTLILAAAVIYENLRTFINLHNYPFFEPLALALFVFSQGWVAAEKVCADERRLLSIESELAIACEIQTSILPSGVPKINNLSISAA